MTLRIAAAAVLLFMSTLFHVTGAAAQDQCLQVRGEFHCQDDGTITYTMQVSNDYDFPTDDVEVLSLTSGITAEAVPFTPVPGSGISAWGLVDAQPGDRVLLRANASQPGNVPGTNLVCSGEIEETIPLDVCEGSVPPDLEVTKIGPASCEAGDTCRFEFSVRNASAIPFEGVPSLRDEPGVTGSRLGVMGPSDTTWSCLQPGGADAITCVSAPVRIEPGESVSFFADIRIPRAMRRGSTFENCAVQAPPEVGPNPTLFAQFMLRTLGFDPGPVDGLMGPRTKNAIEEFQEDAELPVTGEVDEDLLETLTTLGGIDANPENDRDCAEVNVTKTITCGFGEQVVGERCEPICSADANWDGDRCVSCGFNEYWDEDRLVCEREAPECNERTTVQQGNRCVCRYFGMDRVNERRCRCPFGTDLVPGLGCFAVDVAPDCHERTTFQRGDRCICRYDDMERVNENRCRCPSGTDLVAGVGCVEEETAPNCHERTTRERGDRCVCRYDGMERVNERRCRCPDGTSLVRGEGCVADQVELNCHEQTTRERGDRCVCRYDDMERVNERRCRCPDGTDLVAGQGCVAQQTAPDCQERTTVLQGNQCVCRYDGMERVNDRRCRCPGGTELVPGQGCVAPQPAAPDCQERTTVLQGNQCVCRYDGMERVNDRRCRCPGGTELVPGQGCVAPQPAAPDCQERTTVLQGNQCVCRYDGMERVNDRRCRCPGGTELVAGQGCVAPQPATPNCHERSTVFENGRCVCRYEGMNRVNDRRCKCPDGTRFEEGRGCVPRER